MPVLSVSNNINHIQIQIQVVRIEVNLIILMINKQKQQNNIVPILKQIHIMYIINQHWKKREINFSFILWEASKIKRKITIKFMIKTLSQIMNVSMRDSRRIVLLSFLLFRLRWWEKYLKLMFNEQLFVISIMQ